jgi:RNA polymerase sigma-70 factor (ECF subfamily)
MTGARLPRVVLYAPKYGRTARRSEDVLRRVIVAEALSSLSRAHREVLTETVMRNRSVNEAADILGIPLGTAKSRVYYALRALRIVLEERGVST